MAGKQPKVLLLRLPATCVARERDLPSTAWLQTSIRITNRQAGGRACIPDHQAVYEAIASGDSAAASMAMTKLIGDVLDYLNLSRAGFADY